MQTFGLPRQITRGAALASRLCGKEQSDEAHRRDVLKRWRQARADGLTARAAANAVGVSQDPLPMAEAPGPGPPGPALAPPAHPAPASVVGGAGGGRPGDTRRLPHVGQDRRPAAARRARGKREHHRPHPQDPDGARRGHPGPDPAPQRAARRPAPQASRQAPAQGPQAHNTRRDRPTRHPHRLATPRPARHQAVHRP